MPALLLSIMQPNGPLWTMIKGTNPKIYKLKPVSRRKAFVPFTIYNVFYNGKFLSRKILTEKCFGKLMWNELK